MTLNASGPISLGGSTVGQSVNLELGQAATALTSLNATNVRTLLQVPSGQISLSNAYGKSNITAWMLYVGVPWSGSGTAGVQAKSYYVSPGGISAVNMVTNSKTGCFMYVDDTGAILNPSSIAINYGGNLYSSGTWGMATGNNLNSSLLFPLYWDTSRVNAVNSTSSTYMAWYSGTSLLNVPNGSGVNQWAAVDSSGTVTFTKFANQGKSGLYITNTKIDSSGTNTKTFRIDNGFPDTSGTITSLVRTDSQTINVFGDGATYIFVWTTAGTKSALYQVSGFYARNASLNSSDNSLLLTLENGFIITNSSYTSYNMYYLGGGYSMKGGAGYDLFGSAYYNGYYYMATNTNSLNAKLNAFVVFAVNASTGALYWTKKFTFNSGVPTNPFSYGNSRCSIYANAKGCFVAVQTSTPTLAFILNLPLGGGLSNATYSAVNGGAVSMTVSDSGLTTSFGSSGSISTSSTYGWTVTGNSSSTQLTSPNTQDVITFTPKTNLT